MSVGPRASLDFIVKVAVKGYSAETLARAVERSVKSEKYLNTFGQFKE